MESEPQETNTPAHSTDTATISTRSGHPPGTPKPPISPPRRRSSLAFSRVFTCSSPKNDEGEEPESPRKTTDLPRRTPSNTSRKRMPASVHRTAVTPGHVAQMQRKLLQSAKAALRRDMAFAASPTGSIGSRLPADKAASSQRGTYHSVIAGANTSSTGWRFSVAPHAVTGLENDVREPVDEGSPALPDSLTLELADADMLGVEPISSGFTSPIGTARPERESTDILPALPSSPPLVQATDMDDPPPANAALTGSDLEVPMTGLKVYSDDDEFEVDLDESPTVSHLKRISTDPMPSAGGGNFQDDIILSEQARAAAESAKAKRGLLRSLFPKGENRKSTTPVHALRESTRSSGTQCPDPALHRLIEEGKCPDPSAHLRNRSPLLVPPVLSVTPEAAMSLSHYPPHPAHGAWHPRPPPSPPFHRVTATGSPMPFAKMRSRRSSREREVHPPRQSCYSNSSTPQMPAPSAPIHRPSTRIGRPVPTMATEHFQPGWYYAREASGPAEQISPMTYSFSTAAAKVGGQSPAPDSRIRDSYRTDTLTPLARPLNRFRKTGISAAASNRGVTRFYGDNEYDARLPSRRQPGPGRSRKMHNHIQFRSSPPRQTQHMPSQHKRRRPREFEDENIAVGDGERRRQPRLEKEESVMEVDDETRAAVRMSIWGPEAPEPVPGQADGLKKLSPNVTSWRKGMEQRTKKKRRPSYWDGDLDQVRESPAGKTGHGGSGTSQGESPTSPAVAMVQHGGAERRVCTSPAPEEIDTVEEQTGVIGFDGESLESAVRSAEEAGGSFVTGESGKAELVEEMEVETLN